MKLTLTTMLLSVTALYHLTLLYFPCAAYWPDSVEVEGCDSGSIALLSWDSPEDWKIEPVHEYIIHVQATYYGKPDEEESVHVVPGDGEGRVKAAVNLRKYGTAEFVFQVQAEFEDDGGVWVSHKVTCSTYGKKLGYDVTCCVAN